MGSVVQAAVPTEQSHIWMRSSGRWAVTMWIFQGDLNNTPSSRLRKQMHERQTSGDGIPNLDPWSWRASPGTSTPRRCLTPLSRDACASSPPS